MNTHPTLLDLDSDQGLDLGVVQLLVHLQLVLVGPRAAADEDGEQSQGELHTSSLLSCIPQSKHIIRTQRAKNKQPSIQVYRMKMVTIGRCASMKGPWYENTTQE